MDIKIQVLTDQESFRRIVELQREVFGMPDEEIVPRHVLVLISKNCGQILGAFAPDGTLVGYSLAILGYDKVQKRFYLASHMAGVHPSYQSQAVGYALKMGQRDRALAEGIELIKWTYDPLISKNANINLRKLGAEVHSFFPDYYGEVKAGLYGTLPSDRYEVVWNLRGSERVEFPDESPSLVVDSLTDPEVNRKNLGSGAEKLVCPIPLNHLDLRKSDSALAYKWHMVVREISQELLNGSYHIRGFRVNDRTDRGEYLFVKN